MTSAMRQRQRELEKKTATTQAHIVWHIRSQLRIEFDYYYWLGFHFDRFTLSGFSFLCLNIGSLFDKSSSAFQNSSLSIFIFHNNLKIPRFWKWFQAKWCSSKFIGQKFLYWIDQSSDNLLNEFGLRGIYDFTKDLPWNGTWAINLHTKNESFFFAYLLPELMSLLHII